MGVLAYVDPLGAPVLLCILANGAPDAPTTQSGDLLLVMSNGSFDGLCDKLLKKLGAEVPVEATRR